MSGEFALKIWEQARQTNRNNFRIEDMFYTGILRQKAQIPGFNSSLI